MSGYCCGCGESFGFFRKEHSCKNCGYVFCNGCLSKKANIPKLNNEKHKVCGKCLNILERGGAQPAATPAAPPDAYFKRIAALEGGGTTSGNSSAPQASNPGRRQHKSMAKEDVAIAERLQKLKASRKKDAKPVPSTREMQERLEKLKEGRLPPPTEQQMRDRLAVLKGQQPADAATAGKPHQVPSGGACGQQDQVAALLKQAQEEADLDRKIHPQQEDETADVKQESQNDLNLQSKSTKKELAAKNISSTENQDDNIDLSEVHKLIQDVAKENEADARQAVTSLLKDSELLEKLKAIEKNKKKKERKKSNTEEGKEADSESDNEEELTELVIKQILEDNRREEEEEKAGFNTLIGTLPGPPADGITTTPQPKRHTTVPSATATEEEAEELPWCCICNNDATIRCLGCDYDLYCNRCFKEGHEMLDLEDHRTVPFKAR